MDNSNRKKIRILLTQPTNNTQPNMALMLISAALKNAGYKNIKIVENKEYLNTLESYQPQIVGITTVTSTIKKAIILAEKAKQLGAKTILGGLGVTLTPSQALNENVDYVIIGEAEEKISQIVNNIIKGKKQNKFIECGLVKDLDSLPFADRSIIREKNYPVPITLLTSRGCPYNCIYCSKMPNNNKFRARSPESIIKELKFLIKNYPEEYKKSGYKVAIQDDVFNFDKERAKRILKSIIHSKLKIKLIFGAGFHVGNVDEELLKLVKEAGCEELWFGIESGCDEILKNLGKGTCKSLINKTIILARKVGIPRICGHVIIGLPGSNVKIEKESLNFIKSLKLDIVSYNHATPFPGTRLDNYVNANGVKLFNNFEELIVVKGVPFFETKDFSKDERIKSYANAVKYSDWLIRKKSLNLSYLKDRLNKLSFSKIFKFFFGKDLRILNERVNN